MPRRLLCAAPLLVFALSACAGPSSQKGAVADISTTTTMAPTTTTTLAITRADYVNQANAICQTMNERIEALGEPGEDPAELVEMFGQSGVIMSDVLAKLRALPMPVGEESALAAVYAKVDVLRADLDQLIAAIQAGDEHKAIAMATKLEKDQKAANDASNAYGLTVCGS